MRAANWPQILDAKVEEWRRRPLVWGESDCCQFIGDVTAALTGQDRRGQFPSYGTRTEAEAIVSAHGGMVGLLIAAFGASKSAGYAERGDVVAIDGVDGTLAAVCLGPYRRGQGEYASVGLWCCGPGPRGLVFRRMSAAICAWTV